MPQVSLTELIEAARSGNQLVSFPTDTVPALAVRPDSAELIFKAKQRDLSKPLILMGASLDSLWDYVTGSTEERHIWQQVAERYLPGALTLVLPASPRVPVAMNPKDPSTIGVRVPDHAIAQTILTKTGALATTSVNRSGQPPLLNLNDIAEQFPEILTLHPAELSTSSNPVTPSGVPSTVAKWTGQTWQIIRAGAVELEV